jgi:beta-glucosidase
MGGLAVADILLGKYNPSGKLTVSFPRNTGQIPIFYNYKRTSHDVKLGADSNRWNNKYLDIPTTPLFPFGYGLSYTEFTYSNLKISSATINPNQSVNVSVEVSNTGNADGEEVIQLYVGDDVSSVSRPAKELKGFAKIALKQGEKQLVNFTLTPTDFSFYNKDMKWVLEPGSFSIMIGASSADIKFTEKLNIQ